MTIACRLLLAAVLAIASVPANAQEDQVRQFVQGFLQRRQIPGASIAVVKDGRIVLARGYGTANLELNVPATDSTVYEIGSISKQFAAAATLVLVERGKLSLDDPVSGYVPEAPPSWAAITVRHLVSHTSGLPDWESRTAFSYRGNYTTAEFLKLLTPLPLDFPPGERFIYSNTGAPILGLIIEKVSGTDFETFVTENLFKPAGLTTARYKHSGDIIPNRSGGYVEENGALRNGEPHRPRIIAPSGGVMASATDLACWMDALSSGKVMNAASLQLMNDRVRLNHGRTFDAGMGWFIDTYHGQRVMLHNGSTVGGFSSVIYWFPDHRLGVAVQFNVDRWNAVNVLALRVADLYVPGLAMFSLKEGTDPDPAMSRRILGLLNSVWTKTDNDLLGPNLRNPGNPPRTTQSFGFEGRPERWVFLEREELPEGTIRWGNPIRSIYRYRLVAGPRTVHYAFEMNPDGKVVRFVPEEF